MYLKHQNVPELQILKLVWTAFYCYGWLNFSKLLWRVIQEKIVRWLAWYKRWKKHSCVHKYSYFRPFHKILHNLIWDAWREKTSLVELLRHQWVSGFSQILQLQSNLYRNHSLPISSPDLEFVLSSENYANLQERNVGVRHSHSAGNNWRI